MLYDPRCRETRVDPLSIEALVAWLEQQPPEEKYRYTSACGCLAAQYNNSIGRVYSFTTALLQCSDTSFDGMLEDIAQQQPHTFSAALERARAKL